MRMTLAHDAEKLIMQNHTLNPDFESQGGTPKNTGSDNTGKHSWENEMKNNLNRSLYLLDN